MAGSPEESGGSGRDRWRTAGEIARELKVTEETVVGWYDAGELRAVNLSLGKRKRLLRIKQSWVDQFLSKRGMA
ncbi:MAG TPA: helix-turn-helix domain-containing protein [Thermoanaerobaculia bacterium]|nr:helix-turn-helix domain-containing protein [Thermoanaerobaculia bacterium]